MKIHEEVSFISTFSARLFYDKHAGGWETIQKYYPKVNWYLYHENSFEKENTINFDEIDIPDTYHIYDIFEETQLWDETPYESAEHFLKESRFNECDKMSGEWEVDYWNRNSIYWFRKAPSILHASQLCETPLLIYLDADTCMTPKNSDSVDGCDLDSDYIRWAKKHDVLSRHRNIHTETSHISFNLEKRGREFITEFFDQYVSGRVFEQERWDDCWTFDTLVDKLKVSNGPLSVATGAPKDFEGIIDHHKGEFIKVRQSQKGGV